MPRAAQRRRPLRLGRARHRCARLLLPRRARRAGPAHQLRRVARHRRRRHGRRAGEAS